MFIISKEFHFSASHQLTALPQSHPCARLHGHNYIVVIELAAEDLDDFGFVVDYRELAFAKKIIDDEYDHRHLNDVLGHDRVTAENLARHFYERFKPQCPQINAVRVSETPKTWAKYCPKHDD
ncbi:6-carboxytetrahydropterin synthase QueD [Bartonella sp. HY406]|uniref:6-carboxytetrahydropterin synthase QueD n=1 Tax=Bartonella sp. HY406 TaxID=2979331 RepID=UPI0021C7A1C7|nr:6-carboxytetrahydropterin synthase QueD [Bartonella sp. HY406]UXN03580.1 6-carboxytetrahydropterin synthase QueD [Bartonella sp. HY406]